MSKDDEFDANDRVLGFSLVGIKRALGWVGIMDDRDDVRSVSQALTCPEQQAIRVLEELERRGFVTKTEKRRQWKTTQKGHRLGFYWLPPRRFNPAIERESSRCGQGFQSVRCGILRSTEDGADMFEEAEIDPTLSVQYEGERLVEINVTQPHDYDEEEAGGASVELSAFLSVAEAKSFAAALQQAITAAEREAARRLVEDARREKRAEARRLEVQRREKEKRKASPKLGGSPSTPKRGAPPIERGPGEARALGSESARHTARPMTLPRQSIEIEPAAEQRAATIAAALEELRETNRARLHERNKKQR